jgi:ligand-binding SRPBCC domain-containing protein
MQHSRNQDGTYVLETEQMLALPVEQVFEFFSDAMNLEAITPPFLKFRVLTPAPIDMRVGTLIDYKLSLRGVPIRWRTRIAAWEPPFRFIDMQLRGPYKLWHHEHRFEPVGNETRCIDRVEYRHAGGPLVNKLIVRPDLERIFRYRQHRITELLQPAPEPALV